MYPGFGRATFSAFFRDFWGFFRGLFWRKVGAVFLGGNFENEGFAGERCRFLIFGVLRHFFELSFFGIIFLMNELTVYVKFTHVNF